MSENKEKHHRFAARYNSPGCQIARELLTALPCFNADLSPKADTNVIAAQARKWKFDGAVYRDEDGCPMADEFGQPLG